MSSKIVSSSHPTYNSMIKKAIADLNDKKGSSRPAILKYLIAHYKLGENLPKINASLKSGLKRGVTSGDLKQVKGVGASGSFRLGIGGIPKAAAAKKSPRKKTITKTPSVKKATPKKAKKAAPKKMLVAKKVVAAAPPEAPVAVSPVAAKPKAAKTPKPMVAKTPKKRAAKKPMVAKKSPKMIAKKPKTPKRNVAKKL